jgi:oxygen-independent coproporphyrinogen-3 oxidase
MRTIYFGGTPSVLSSDEINFLIDSVYENYEVGKTQKSHSKPILMICRERILELSKSKINRLSIEFSLFLKMI